MQAIKELADRLDGRPAQILEHSGPETPVIRFVREIVHVTETRDSLDKERPWLGTTCVSKPARCSSLS